MNFIQFSLILLTWFFECIHSYLLSTIVYDLFDLLPRYMIYEYNIWNF